MEIRETPFTFIQQPAHPSTKPAVPAQGHDFQSKLLTSANTPKTEHAGRSEEPPALPPLDRIEFGSRAAPQATPVNAHTAKAAAGAYEKQGFRVTPSGLVSDVVKYKDDQLLSSPGGDHYDLENKRHVADPPEQQSLWGRIGKNIRDAVSNVKNFAGNLLFGATRHYRDENGEIQEGQRRGLVGSVADFFQDLGSAFSFGAWRPDGEEKPEGFGRRVGFFFSKLKEAVFGDLIQGVAGSVVNMGKDLVFAGWNLIETIPDATIGNFEAGRKITTAVFDNGQVALNYIADILPGGDASIRVHSPDLKNLKAPILNNLSMPESNPEDTRWKYVRNTPFRKSIETVGSVLSSILTLRFLTNFRVFGEKRNNPE
ncbi:MAG: hypothetical protein R6V25_03775 [Desulfatiglandales bacterium]